MEPEFCVSNKLPRDTSATGLWSTVTQQGIRHGLQPVCVPLASAWNTDRIEMKKTQQEKCDDIVAFQCREHVLK